MSIQAGPNQVENGLVLYLDAGNLKSYSGSGTTCADLSLIKNNSTFLGNTSFSTAPNTFNTNSVDRFTLDGLSLGANIEFADTSSYSLCFMIKLRVAAEQTFNTLCGRISTSRWLSIVPFTSTFDIRYRENDSTYRISSGINYDLKQNWGYIVLTIDATRTVRFYLNGSFLENLPTPTSTIWTINRIATGYDSGGNYYSLQGSLAFCQIYNKTLTDLEVQQNFNAHRGRFGL